MCAYVCVCVCVCMYVYVCVCVCVSAFLFVHLCVNIFMYTYVHVLYVQTQSFAPHVITTALSQSCYPICLFRQGILKGEVSLYC